jgi:radical SAM-linked protein
MQSDQQRLRITFSKGENLRYISHLDLLRTWERVLRRAGIPVAYTKGYNPHPRIVFAAALSVGCTAEAEVMDVVLSQPMPPRRVLQGLGHQMPDGLGVKDVTPVYNRAPALPTLLYGAEYEIVIESDRSLEEARRRCDTLLERSELPRLYRGKQYDLRPLVDRLQVTKVNEQYLMMRMQLAAGERGTGRPDEVLDELGWGDVSYYCNRKKLRFEPWADQDE